VSALVFYEVPRGAHDILRTALAEAGLPTADIAQPGRLFFGLSDDRGLIGYIGLEGDGADRLVRSLVVLPSRRGSGHGSTLVARLEAVLPGEVERLHLLTATAAPFFRRLGYADSDRRQAPDAIAATEQFASLCPASASYLVKTLDRPA
jgi:amino-acid N-acetyltransferase